MDNHHDKLICKIFITQKNKVNGRRVGKIKNNLYLNIKQYLDNRYNDSESYTETIRRIQNKIEIRPVCKECGRHIKFCTNNKDKFFQEFCSRECVRKSNITQERIKQTCLKKYGVINGGGSKQALEKIKKTCQEKYGVDNVFYLKEVQEKKKKSCFKHYGVEYNLSAKEVRQSIKQTCLKKYGVINGGGSKQALEKIKKTCQEKYGVDNVFYLKEVQEKKKNTWISKYGVDHPFKYTQIKENRKSTFINRYGVENPYNFFPFVEKMINTKRKNHTFNSSKPEEELYLYIKEKFPNVKRQYKDKERYPWCCDFYIPELDYFIEYNGFVSHGNHAYNHNSKKDQDLLQKWKLRYNNGSCPLYKKMIEGWTIYDVKKRETAKKNNLNFYEFWNLKEAKKFIDSI